MIVKILESNDNISDYMRCIEDLNDSNNGITSEEDIKNTLATRPLNVLTFVGVLADKTIVATATVIMEKKLRYHRLCCHIEDVGVHPDFRKKGYGKTIVEYCVKVALHNNCYKIKLNCADHLVKFYGDLGFEMNGNHMFIKGDNK